MKLLDLAFMKHSTMALLVLGALLLAQQSTANADEDAPPETLKSGVLTVGSDLTYPPYYSTENGKPVGFGPDMVRALAGQLGLTARFQNTKFAQLIVQLKAHRFDVVASALYITPERAREVDYVPLFQTGNSIIVRRGADFVPTRVADLCGHTVSVIQGASVLDKLSEDESSTCPDGQGIDIAQYPTAPEATQAVMARAADAQIADAAVSKQIVDKTGGRLQISTHEVLYPVPVGLAVTQGNRALQSALESALTRLRDNGTYQKLLNAYNLQAPDPDLLKNALGQAD